MTRRDLLLGAAAAAALVPTRASSQASEQAKRFRTIDTLAIDAPDFDAALMRAGGMDAAVVDLMIYPRGAPEAEAGLREWNEAEKLPNSGFRIVRSAQDLAAASAARKFGVILASQDASILGPSLYSVNDFNLETLRKFHGIGLRVLQLTHNERNGVGDGFRERTDAGLSLLGEAVVAEMGKLGMLIDLSHCSDETTKAAIRLSQRPVAVTHAGCRSLYASKRNKPDEVIRALADKGGYFGVFMMTRWLTDEPNASVDTVVRHIEHAMKVGGVGTVGFGSDQPLLGDPTPQAEKVASLAAYQNRNEGLAGAEPLRGHVTAPDLDAPNKMQTLERALQRRGHKTAIIEGILGANFERVLTRSLS